MEWKERGAKWIGLLKLRYGAVVHLTFGIQLCTLSFLITELQSTFQLFSTLYMLLRPSLGCPHVPRSLSSATLDLKRS